MPNIRLLCAVAQTVISGIVGYFAGLLAETYGFTTSTASAFAGLTGFMSTQGITFLWIVLHARYNKE